MGAFIKLKFEGARFPAARMPLECLPELAAYRDLVVAFAKTLFLAEHPGRQRLPKGYEASLQLVLDRIEQGSTVPVVERVEAVQLPIGFGTDYFERGRDLVNDTLKAIENNAPLPQGVSGELLARFSMLGRTLAPTDRMLFLSDGDRQLAQYSQELRRRALHRAHVAYEDDVDLVGYVRGADLDRDGFNLRLASGLRVSARASATTWPAALRALSAEMLVRVRGVGQFDAEGVLEKILRVSDLSPAEEGEGTTRRGCSIPIGAQIDGLTALPSGWMDGDGEAFEPSATRRVGERLGEIVSAFDLPTPYLYPTVNGDVRAEWSRPGWEIAAEFSPVTEEAAVFAVSLTEDDVRERHLRLSEPGGELKLGRFLAEQISERAS